MFTMYTGKKSKTAKVVLNLIPESNSYSCIEIPLVSDDLADTFHQQAEHAFYNQGGVMRQCDYCDSYYPFFPYGIKRFTCFDPACEQRYLNRVHDEYKVNKAYFEEQERRDEERHKEHERREVEREIAREERAKQEYLDRIEQGEKHGYVYLLASSNGYHKIGRSIDVMKRLSELQREFPVKITLVHRFASQDYFKAEMILHERFSEQRMAHEWFELSTEQLDWIMGIENYDLDPYIVDGDGTLPV